jgi:hypothetical protein
MAGSCYKRSVAHCIRLPFAVKMRRFVVCLAVFTAVSSSRSINTDHLHRLLEHLTTANRQCVERKLSLPDQVIGEFEAYFLIIAALEYCVEELIDRQLDLIVDAVGREDKSEVECDKKLLKKLETNESEEIEQECEEKFEKSYAKMKDDMTRSIGDIQTLSCGSIGETEVKVIFLKLKIIQNEDREFKVRDEERVKLREEFTNKSEALLSCLLGKVQNLIE